MYDPFHTHMGCSSQMTRITKSPSLKNSILCSKLCQHPNETVSAQVLHSLTRHMLTLRAKGSSVCAPAASLHMLQAVPTHPRHLFCACTIFVFIVQLCRARWSLPFYCTSVNAPDHHTCDLQGHFAYMVRPLAPSPQSSVALFQSLQESW